VSDSDSQKKVVSPATSRSQYSPTPTAGAAIFLRDCPVEIRIADEGVRVAFGLVEPRRLAFTAQDVTRWCAETSVLMRVTFGLAAGDEVSVRAPMLLDRRGAALAVMRRSTTAGSCYAIAIAATSADLANERQLSSIDASLDEVQSFLMALESAAAAATLSRDAKG
jgi:hypothetical protein